MIKENKLLATVPKLVPVIVIKVFVVPLVGLISVIVGVNTGL